MFVFCFLMFSGWNAAEALDPMDFGGGMVAVAGGKGLDPSIVGNLSNGIGLGYIKVGTSDVFSITWSPDFKIGPWGVGVDINAPVGNTRPEGYDNVVFRYAEYDDGAMGVRYGVLDNVTLGKGMVMDNYSTRVAQPLYLNNNQVGVKAYYKTANWGVLGMGTWSHLYALRLTQQILPWLVLGQTAVTDDGVKVTQTDGVIKDFPPVSGYGVDATIPLPLNMQAYSEYALLAGHGGGLGTGIDWSTDFQIAKAYAGVEYRMLDKGFVPGYFSCDYEINPVDLSSVEASGKPRNGYVGRVGLTALSVFSASGQYQNYFSDPSAAVNAQATLKATDKVIATYYFDQPNFVDFRSLDLEQGAVQQLAIAYQVNSNTKIITTFKKAYDPAQGKVVESQYYQVVFSL